MTNWDEAQTTTLHIENCLHTLNGDKLGSLVRDSTDFGKKAIDHSQNIKHGCNGQWTHSEHLICNRGHQTEVSRSIIGQVSRH